MGWTDARSDHAVLDFLRTFLSRKKYRNEKNIQIIVSFKNEIPVFQDVRGVGEF